MMPTISTMTRAKLSMLKSHTERMEGPVETSKYEMTENWTAARTATST